MDKISNEEVLAQVNETRIMLNIIKVCETSLDRTKCHVLRHDRRRLLYRCRWTWFGKLTDRQTDKLTNKPRQEHNLLCGGIIMLDVVTDRERATSKRSVVGPQRQRLKNWCTVNWVLKGRLRRRRRRRFVCTILRRFDASLDASVT